MTTAKYNEIKSLIEYAYERFTDNKKHLDQISDECSVEFLQDIISETKSNLCELEGSEVSFWEEAHTARDFDLCRKLQLTLNTAQYYLQRKIELQQSFMFSEVYNVEANSNPTPNKEISELWDKVKPVCKSLEWHKNMKTTFPNIHLTSF